MSSSKENLIRFLKEHNPALYPEDKILVVANDYTFRLLDSRKDIKPSEAVFLLGQATIASIDALLQ